MSSSPHSSLDPDQVFEILSSRRRRRVLYYLRKHGDTATMNDLAEQVAAWENDVDIDELTSQQRKRVYVSLYQTHLPKLADTGLVDYEVDDGIVTLTDRAAEIDNFLSATPSSSYSWKRHYLVLLIGGAAAIVAGVLATPVVGVGLLLWVAGGLFTGYLTTVLVEYWHYRNQLDQIPAELKPQE